MRIRAHQGIRVGERALLVFAGKHGSCQIFQIDLVHDSGLRRYHFKIGKGCLPPFQEAVTLGIALVFELLVFGKGRGAAKLVDLYRVIDHQLSRLQRIDLFRIAAQLLHGIAHSGKVNHGRDTGEILHQHPRRREGDFLVGFGLGFPVDEGLNIGLADHLAIFMAQQIFQQNLQGEGQARCIFHFIQTVDDIFLPVDLERAARLETIGHEDSLQLLSSGVTHHEGGIITNCIRLRERDFDS